MNDDLRSYKSFHALFLYTIHSVLNRGHGGKILE
jgi:hypothetical protein